MNFLMMQSLGTYTKNMEMQMKWQQKKKNNDFSADGKTKLNDPTAQMAEEIRQSQADGSSKLSSQIRTKLASGKKLTREEMEYLQKTDPQTYQKAKSMEYERKSYEKELERCKTKEDVQRVKTNHTAASLSVVNSVKNNPAIPEGAKLGIMWQELMKTMALEETIHNFVASGRYAQLPTEAEKLEAEENLKEAEEAALGIEEPAEAAQAQEPPENGVEAGSTDTAGTYNTADKAKEAALFEGAIHKSKAALREHKMTRTEAEAAPEALKVKRAKARAAYQKNQIEELPNQVMDFKAI